MYFNPVFVSQNLKYIILYTNSSIFSEEHSPLLVCSISGRNEPLFDKLVKISEIDILNTEEKQNMLLVKVGST